jgi:predicted nuclease of predicted toxin-antitoxin system
VRVEVAKILQEAGHDALTVIDEAVGGAPDADIAALVRRENRALITLDLGFADIRAYPPQEFPGLIVLRLARQDKEHLLRVCARLVEPCASEPLVGRLWIVEASRIRVRRREA